MTWRRPRAVLLTVEEHGTPDSQGLLDESTVEQLIDCERRGIRVVLWLTAPDDLHSPLAGLATHLATDDEALCEAAVDRIGAERTLPVAHPEDALRQAAAEVLPPGDRAPAGPVRQALRRTRRTARRAAGRARRLMSRGEQRPR